MSKYLAYTIGYNIGKLEAAVNDLIEELGYEVQEGSKADKAKKLITRLQFDLYTFVNEEKEKNNDE